MKNGIRLVRALFLLGLLGASMTAMAQDPNVSLQKQLVSPAADSTVPPGSDVRYRITYACNGVSQPNCGTLDISDSLPPELEIVSCDFPGFTVNSCAVGTNGVSVTRTITSGVTGEGFINARVRPSAGPALNVINTATATFTNNPGGQTLPVVAVSPAINISAAAQRNYSITKTRVDPIAALVISDQITFVTDRVQFCATSGIDLVELQGVSIYDDTPSIASNIRTSLPAGAPAIGESIVGNRITWTIPAARLDIDALYPPGANLGAASCFSFLVTYDLPADAALAQNRAHARSTDSLYCSEAGLGVPPIGSTDEPQCFGESDGVRGGPQSIGTVSKSGNDAAPSDTPDDFGIGRINWNLGGSFESNVGLRDVEYFDVLPTENTGTPARLEVSSFTLGNWLQGAPIYDVVADVYVTTTVPSPTSDCGGIDWMPAEIGAAHDNATTVTTGLAGITGICWAFRNASVAAPANELPRDFAFTSSPGITQPVPSTITPPALPGAIMVQNCFQVNWDAGGAQTENTCRTQRIEDPRPGVDPIKLVQSAPSQLRPLDEIIYRVGVDHASGDSTGDIVNPVVVDVLPAELEFIDATPVSPLIPVPVVTVLSDTPAAGQTLVRIAYTGTFPRNTGSADMPRVDIRTRVAAGTADGAYSNRVAVFENGNPNTTCAGTEVADADDYDGDMDTAENRCERDVGFTIVQAAVLDGTKWVSGPGPFDNPADQIVDDSIEAPVTATVDCPVYHDVFSAELGVGVDANPYTRFPCVARTEFAGSFSYRIRVQNAGNVAFDNYVIYDVLPFVGDTGVGEPQSTVTRNSRYRPLLTGAPTVLVGQTDAPIAGKFSIEYSASTDPCRPEMSDDTDTGGWQGGCTDDWSATPPGGDFANVRAFRIFAFTDPSGADGVNWGRLETVVFEVPMQAPPFVSQPTTNDALPSVVGSSTIFNPSYGSFSHRAYRAVNGSPLDVLNLLPTAEPVKVGVILPERYRIGNLVWRDTNNDGDVDQGEPGLDGVDVFLCRDDDGTPGPSVGDSQVDSTTTATIGSRLGKYRFDNVQRQSDYYVAIPSGQAPLTGLVVSTGNNGNDPNNDTDNDNNAQAAAAANSCGGPAFVSAPSWSVGIASASEPTNERTHTSSGHQDDDPMQGGGTDLWPDAMSNFSADFGFASGSNNADLGDLPDTGNGDTTGNYRTVLSDNGPSHLQTTDLTLGLLWDAELEGQPISTALGDDSAGIDDEDGVVDVSELQFFRGQPAQVQVRVVNDSGSDARLCGFVDWNADGDFDDTVNGTSERVTVSAIASGTGPAGSVIVLDWGTVPFPGATIDPAYARFRLSLDTGTCGSGSSNGPSNSGEVEDYQAAVIAIDRGDLPDGTAGIGTGDYQTLIANGGPSHTIRSTLRLGSQNDADIEGQPSATAVGDDSAPGGQPDDEDGITPADLSLIAGAAETVGYTVTNTTGNTATVCGYIDFYGDGDFLDAGELAQDSVNTGANNANRTLAFSVPTDAVSSSFARFRVFTAAANGGAICSPDGDLLDGEVEDYPVSIAAFDLGDLPDSGAGIGGSNYQTLLSDSGARHPMLPGFPSAPNLFMGAGVDAEADGQPGASADGDDGNGSDDEDGVNLAELSLIVNIPVTVNVAVTNNAGAAARLCGFIDFTGDGDFADPGETTSASIPDAFNGSMALDFGAPLVGAASSTYARFRLSTDTGGSCSASGDATDGEVEDYVVSIAEPSDQGDLPDVGAGTASGDYETLSNSNGARHPLRPGLRFGALVDDENDGLPSAGADGDDLDTSDDEDGITIADLAASNLIAGSAANVRFTATNTTGVAARACGYIDFNGDGDFADAAEVAEIAVADGSADAALSFVFNVPTADVVNTTFARFRLSTQAGACSGATANGVEPDGEVEDYQAAITIQDWGDLPDTAAGTASNDYRTLASDNGPVHPIVAGLRLGAAVDAEADGQPGNSADGDDANQSGQPAADDEDGVTVATLVFTAGIAQDVELTATNTTGLAARVCGFIDFDRDGEFTTAGEVQEVALPDGSTDLPIALNFTAPLNTPFGELFARFRLSTDTAGACVADGPASDGEVEDYSASVGNVDLGDLPDSGAGTGSGNYNTLRADDGAEHQIVDGLFMGASVDQEADGQPAIDADGDDVAAPGAPVDDEDGVDAADLILTATTPGIVPVLVTNLQSSPADANLCGYIDFNGDGDFLDVGESASAVVADGSNNVTANLDFGTVLDTSVRATYARFRLTTDACSPTGFASNGEVEDYAVTVNVFDFGDLPDSIAGTASNDYRTLTSDNGPVHPIIAGLRLGATVDPEADGQPGNSADGDDANQSGQPAADDEDGVTVATLVFTAGIAQDVDLTATNTTGLAARVCGFIDFDRDGEFVTAGETQAVALPDGSTDLPIALNFTAPLDTPFGELFARFRLSTDTAGDCVADGPASDGEVEDYLAFVGNVDLGDLPDSGAGTGSGDYNTLRADDGAEHQIVDGLFMGAGVDQEADGQPTPNADGDDNAAPGVPVVDDEDGVDAADLILTATTPGIVPVLVTNLQSSPADANLCGYIDFNGDGDFLDAGESASAVVADGSNNVTADLHFGIVSGTSVSATYARFRLTTDACSPTGFASNGEVEDYAVRVNVFDFGDLPDSIAGTASNDYRTLTSDNGPVHPIIAGLRLGAIVDPEADGQPSNSANGDDANQSGQPAADDEDGVTVATLVFTAGIAQDVELTATNTTGLAARVCGFIDFDRDGEFTTAGEVQAVALPDGSTDLPIALNFTAPLNTPFGELFARFRLSTDTVGACVADGPASNGEVEDYLAFVGNVDLGDLPDSGAGTDSGDYNTLRADDGAEHQIVDGLFMGASVDQEADGQPAIDADGDDVAAPGAPVDDEDGVDGADLILTATTPGVVPVLVTNLQSSRADANLCGYIDFNGDGDFLDAGESASAVVADGSNNVTASLDFGTVPATLVSATYARFRLTTDACSPTGFASNGEVEDYPVTVHAYDFGDLPDSIVGSASNDYQTRLADGGPRHEIVTGLYLGNQVDPESDGQPTNDARGDDSVGLDDEDGVTFQTPYELGSPARVAVRATNLTAASALICGYVDWNGDGDFADSNEFIAQAVPAGSNDVNFMLNFGLAPIKAGLMPYARFRLSTDASCSVTGDASDGEVEDYRIDTTGNGALELGDHVWHDINNDCHFDAGEPGIPDVTVRLFLDADNDGQPDGPAIGIDTTDADGRYRFIDLLPNHYVVEIDRPTRYLGSTGSGWPYQSSGSCLAGVDPDDDVNEDDNGFELGAITRSPPITLVAENEPGPPNADTNPTIDFGLVYNFDLALNKQLGQNQSASIQLGQPVDYDITVTNEGSVPAHNIWVRDRFPPGFAYIGSGWTEDGDGRSATFTIAGPLLPGESVLIPIQLRALNGAGGTMVNEAEIIDAEDDFGSDPIDIDSVVDNSQTSEDDQRGVPVLLPPMMIPATDLWALLLIGGLALLLGWRRRPLSARR